MRDLKPFNIQNKIIFSKWVVKPFGIYTLCLQEKSYVFLIWDKKSFLFKYFNLKR